MNNPLLDIFNHFGEEAQLEKLKEEVNEFIEAVQSGDVAHMEEEYADVMVCMAQFKFAKKLNEDNIWNTTTEKTVRTLKRIKTGHYEKTKKAHEFEYPKSMSLDGGIDDYSIGFDENGKIVNDKRYGEGDCRGRKVKFKGIGGYDSELKRALETFEVGQILTIKEIHVGRSSSSVTFEESNYSWNTVMFEDIETD